jgi:hypothetical protein
MVAWAERCKLHLKLSGHGPPAATVTQEAAAVSGTASTADVDLATDPEAATATSVVATASLTATTAAAARATARAAVTAVPAGTATLATMKQRTRAQAKKVVGGSSRG